MDHIADVNLAFTCDFFLRAFLQCFVSLVATKALHLSFERATGVVIVYVFTPGPEKGGNT